MAAYSGDAQNPAAASAPLLHRRRVGTTVRLRAAATVLVCYLLFSSYGYIRAATRHIQQMAYIGLGVTEFRILLALWPFAAMALGVPQSLHDRLPAIDVAVIGLALVAVVGLLVKLLKDGRRIAAASATPNRDE